MAVVVANVRTVYMASGQVVSITTDEGTEEAIENHEQAPMKLIIAVCEGTLNETP